MEGMPRPRPPHLHRETTRHGKAVWYVRVGKGPRIRLRAAYGTPEFQAEYDNAIAGTPARKETGVKAGTLAWLIARYRETTAWSSLSDATRRQRENIFKHVVATTGLEDAAEISTTTISAARDRRRDTPAQARNFLDAMRGLFRWAADAKLVPSDPTQGVRNPARKTGDGFIPWTEEHVEKYREYWGAETRQRVWMEVLLASGLRRGDAVRFGRQHIRTVELPDGRKIKLAFLNTEKSKKEVPAIFPITEEFERAMQAGQCGDMLFICGAGGGPLTKESFGNLFRDACEAAQVPGSAHGLRKLAAIRAAHKGATTAQLRALFAWVNDSMPSLYTRAADRERLAIQAAMVLADSGAGITRNSPIESKSTK